MDLWCRVSLSLIHCSIKYSLTGHLHNMLCLFLKHLNGEQVVMQSYAFLYNYQYLLLKVF